jgi:hypothetical protein
MADTSLAPGYIRGTYTGTLFPHHFLIPIKNSVAFVPGVEPIFLQKDLADISMSAAVAGLLAKVKAFFPSSVKFGLVECHSVNEDTGEDQFIYSLDAGVSGTSVATRVALSQAVFNYKTVIGGQFRLYLMESDIAVDQKFTPPFGAGRETDLSDYVTAADTWLYGRDNAYPFSTISLVSKTNDALRKQQGLA